MSRGDNTITYIDESIDYWGDQVTQYIDNSITYIDESIDYWGDQITQNITNIIGVSQDILENRLVDFAAWVHGLLSELDPHNVLPDPQGYIATAFNTLIAPWVEGIVRSFWEGFEEGSK